MQQSIQLKITAEALERFCRNLVERSRNNASTLDTLVSLETFISEFGKSAEGSADYAAVKSLLRSFSEQARHALLEQRTGELQTAFGNRDRDAIAGIHVRLSRDGFYQILQKVIARLPVGELQSLAAWSTDWSQTAKRRAEHASGYPDALDFIGAGIRPEDYQAMLDVSRALEGFTRAR